MAQLERAHDQFAQRGAQRRIIDHQTRLAVLERRRRAACIGGVALKAPVHGRKNPFKAASTSSGASSMSW